MDFAIGQPLLQLLNLIIGFFLLRWMSVENYAQYGAAFAFQSTLSMIADLGFSSSILALSGGNAQDPSAIGRYLRSARYWRLRFTIVVGTLFTIAFPFIVSGQPWDMFTKFGILFSILAAVSVQVWMIYQIPLLAHRSVLKVYKPQLACSAIRLTFISILHAMNALNGLLASWVGTIALGISGAWMKRSAAPLVREPPKSIPEANFEMLKYLAPLMPGVLFTAFQSQISIGIITIFGSTQNIAEVAALGRLGQLFGILAAFNSVFIAPYFSSLPKIYLKKRYLQVFMVAIIISVSVSLTAFLLPEPLLWLLGNKYQNLENEVGIVVSTACIGFLGSVMWTIHAARKWIFWWGTFLYIFALSVSQIVSAIYLNLETTRGVVVFGFYSICACLVPHIATMILGFLYSEKNKKI